MPAQFIAIGKAALATTAATAPAFLNVRYSSGAIVSSLGVYETTLVSTNDGGLTSKGYPYFAAIWEPLLEPGSFTYPVSTVDSWTVKVQVHQMPVKLASDEEVHALMSWGEVSGATIAYIGITPSGRVVASAGHGSIPMQTVAGTIRAGSGPRVITLQRLSDKAQRLTIDGAVAVQQSHGNSISWALTAGYPGRIMFFNDNSGRTRVHATIYFGSIETDNNPVSWLFEETSGASAASWEGDIYNDSLSTFYSSQLRGGTIASDYDTNFDLQIRWFDDGARPWGSLPTIPIADAFMWSRLKLFRRLSANSASAAMQAAYYHPEISSGFSRRGPVRPVYRRRGNIG